MKKGLTILSFLFSSSVYAELISLPEACFERQVAPCLMKVTGAKNLVQSKLHFEVGLDVIAILKIKSFSKPLQIELLQGSISIQALASHDLDLKLNEISFRSKQVFARMQKRKMTVYDTQSFILSEYDLGDSPDQEAVLAKADFPTKVSLVRFVAGFFHQKNKLMSFLKQIEPAWQKEFKAQTDRQTKVLKRSVASLEMSEIEKRLQAEAEVEELKKVRDLFFYRTFYR